MVPAHVHERHRHPGALLQRLLEYGGLRDFQAHIQPDQHQYTAGDKRNPPAEAQELRIRQRGRQQQEDATRREETERRAELWKHPVPRAFPRWRVFRREQHGAAPFPAEPEALAEAAAGEEQRRQHADRGVGRQQADQHRGDAHGQQCGDQRGLAPDPVPEMSEHNRADRPGEEREGKSGERLQRGRRGIRRREKLLREDQHRRRREDVEVEKLDRGPRQAGQQHATRGVGGRNRGRAGRAHAGRG